MKLTDFSSVVLNSEESSVSFLKEHGIFNDENAKCRGSKNKGCGSLMGMEKRRSGPGWICKKKTRRSRRTIRTNKFFTYMDKNRKSHCNLSLCKIMSSVYVWLMTRVTLSQAIQLTGCAKSRVCDWRNMCREVCTQVIESDRKLVGTADRPVQVDESSFSGKRKYHLCRNLAWYRRRELHGELPNWQKEQLEVNGEESNPRSNRNYGNRVTGPWAVGLCESNEKVCFVVVPDRRASALLSVTQEYVEEGSVIVTDEWRGYVRLSENGYRHYTVNHSQNFFNPTTHYLTQGIERMWVDSKMYMKHARHPGPLL